MKHRVLLVEDEVAISEPLAEHLTREGFDAEVADTIEGARLALLHRRPDIVLLDVMLPDGDGRDLCREIRKDSDLPIIMLTARGEETDRIVGLELGADDYVVKPFSAGELVARMRGILRRGRGPARRGPIEVGPIVLDPGSRTVVKAGSPVELAAKEFDLLHELMANAGDVVTRENIMDEVWDPHWFGPTKTLDVHISWLRKKLEDDPSHPVYITTVRRARGRRLACDESALEIPRKGGRTKLRSRLVLAFGYILLVVIVALTIPLTINLRARARSELEGQALLSAQTIAAGIGKEGLKSGPALNREVATYADQVDGRVIVTDADGTVLADSSNLARPGSADYATCGRPEILSALGLTCLDARTGRVGSTNPSAPKPDTTIRYSHTLGADLLAAAAPVLDQGKVFGAVRITQNIEGVNTAVRRVTVAIALIGLAGLAAGMLVAFALANSLARPLTKLASTAQRLGDGDLSARAGDVGGASEIRALGESFDEMAGRVERTVRSQREFVANASHQLRTPLTGMKLRLEAAAAETNDPELKRQIAAADIEVDRLADTVDRMLVMARGVEEGRATPVDLRDVAVRAVDRWKGPAEKLGVSVVAVGDGGYISADPLDIDQVMDNLLDNALAHGAGPVRIEASQIDAEVRLSVSDHGPGIPKGEQSMVTERFFRGKGAGSGGSGLGLSIARELVAKWGGDLDVSNDESGGARIVLRFPSQGQSTPTRSFTRSYPNAD